MSDVTISEGNLLHGTVAQVEAESGLSATILIVDDDRDALELLTMVMERVDFRVLRARDGEEALALAKEHCQSIDAVVLDIMMPGGLDGYEVCARMKSEAALQNLPVIILSARSSPEDMAKSYDMGAVQHISKPYDVPHLLAAVQSMIRLRKLERNATIHSEKYRAIVDHSPLRMALLSSDMTILETNRAFRAVYPDAQIGDNLIACVYDEPPEGLHAHPVTLAFESGQVLDGVVKGVRGGKVVSRRVYAAPIKDKNGVVIAVIEMVEDITQQHKTEERLQQQLQRHSRALRQQELLADHLMQAQRDLKKKNQELEDTRSELERLSVTDALTSLHNRRYFDQALPHEWRRAARYNHEMSVAMMDIDHFKALNDKHGHPAGDEVLQAVANTIHEQLRETDVTARYGGEEFVAILPETDGPMAQLICDRLRKRIGEVKVVVNDVPLRVTISIGVATTSGNAVPAEALLKRADTALYAAKSKGRNQVALDADSVGGAGAGDGI